MKVSFQAARSNRLIDGFADELPAINFSHVDLAGGEQRPSTTCGSISRWQSLRSIRVTPTALSFAKLRSEKNQVPHLGSKFRAGSLQSLANFAQKI